MNEEAAHILSGILYIKMDFEVCHNSKKKKKSGKYWLIFISYLI